MGYVCRCLSNIRNNEGETEMKIKEERLQNERVNTSNTIRNILLWLIFIELIMIAFK